jgi:hypothetical protein
MITIVSMEPLIVRIERGECLKIMKIRSGDFLLDGVCAADERLEGRVLLESGTDVVFAENLSL